MKIRRIAQICVLFLTKHHTTHADGDNGTRITPWRGGSNRLKRIEQTKNRFPKKPVKIFRIASIYVLFLTKHHAAHADGAQVEAFGKIALFICFISQP